MFFDLHWTLISVPLDTFFSKCPEIFSKCPAFLERNGKGEKCHKVPILKILTNDGFGLRALRAVKRLKD